MEQKDIIRIYSPELTIQNASEDGNRLNIEGWAAHFNRANLNGEVTDKNSYNVYFQMRNEGKIRTLLNYEHTDTVIGDVDDIECKNEGLWVKCHLNKGVKINDEMIIPNVLAGTLNSFSTEGIVQGGYDGIVELDNGNFYVKNLILTSLSIVRTPADWDATFSVANFLQTHKPKEVVTPTQLRWWLY